MSLEKDIERIADALEAIAKTGVKSPEEKGAAAAQQAPGQLSAQQAPRGNWTAQQPMHGNGQTGQMQRPMPQGGQVPVSQPAGTGMQWPGPGGSTAMPGGLPPRQPDAPFQQPGMVPTTAAAQQYTFDQLAVATANLASAGKDVFTILGRFGVSMLIDLPPEKFGEYAAALREAGAVV